jgi:SAM-dependent methyltransferase
MTNPDKSDAVRRQYEALPYPARDPEDERRRLVGTWLDDLALLNHHCFGGRREFGAGFRALVAGGGTGDGTIFLAEQLRGSGAEIVHLDISTASIDIARRRAEIRKLDGIQWVHASLLDLPRLDLGTFDYVNCVGVLHHLPDPEQGLDALLGALAPDGAMSLLLYGQYGRTGIYHMQSLLQRLGCRAMEPAAQIQLARALLENLPGTNWFRRSEDLTNEHKTGGDAGIVDLLLHPLERAYTVPQIYAMFADKRGLNLRFSDVQRGRLPYSLDYLFGAAQPSLQQAARALAPRDQQAVAELLMGDLTTHSFYATRGKDTAAPYGDLDYVPFFLRETHQSSGMLLSDVIDRHKNQPFPLEHSLSGLRKGMDPGRYVRYIFQYMDGDRSWQEIFDALRNEPALRKAPPLDDVLFAEFRPWYDVLGSIERLLLRHRSAPPVKVGVVAAG